MSILDDEDVLIKNTQIEIERIMIQDFLANYCGSSRIFEKTILLELGLAKEIAVQSKYNHNYLPMPYLPLMLKTLHNHLFQSRNHIDLLLLL